MRAAVSRFADLMSAKLDELDPDHTHAYRNLPVDELEEQAVDCLESLISRVDRNNDTAVMDANVTIATHLMMMVDKTMLEKNVAPTIPV